LLITETPNSSQGAPKLADEYLVMTPMRAPLSDILADRQSYGSFKFEIRNNISKSILVSRNIILLVERKCAILMNAIM
jgi:hypothetical protein